MKTVLSLRFVFLLAAALFGSSLALAQNLDEVKARMAQRQGAVDALKERFVVGENNRGFLEARGSLDAAGEKTVSDENADRREVYAALAAQTNSSPDTVGRRRAQQIALSSKRGVWIQQAGGEWVQKG